MPPSRISRRDALRLTFAAGAATAAPHPGQAAPPAWQQAPGLAQASTQGKLPGVGQRLPARPEVVQPTAGAGRYGGVMRTAVRGDADHNAILRIIGNMGLTRWSPDFARPVPNVAESWTTNADASVYTFKLRQGMRWSDCCRIPSSTPRRRRNT
jgi:peptide/nickel transport system substrate-binding protein